MKIFLDVDCVLADFIGGVAGWYGLTSHRLEEHWQPGEYGFGHAVQAEARISLSPKVIEATFWKGVEGSGRFWSDLDQFGWTHDLIDLAAGYDPDYHHLTSPSDCGYCLVGKHQWLEKLRGKGEGRRMIPIRDKYLLAAPGRLLVDDHEGNTDRWVAAGGVAILFPALHNRRHADRNRAWRLVAHEIRVACEGGAT